jgi:hypothetical protein
VHLVHGEEDVLTSFRDDLRRDGREAALLREDRPVEL